MPQRLFDVFMSVHPVLAGLAGLVLLGQVLDVHEWLGIAIVVAAGDCGSAVVTRTAWTRRNGQRLPDRICRAITMRCTWFVPS